MSSEKDIELSYGDEKAMIFSDDFAHSCEFLKCSEQRDFGCLHPEGKPDCEHGYPYCMDCYCPRIDELEAYIEKEYPEIKIKDYREALGDMNETVEDLNKQLQTALRDKEKLVKACEEKKKYKIITLCGSTKFKDAYMEAQKNLTMQGHIVISVGVFGHADSQPLTEKQKEMLDSIHLRKIDMSDEIFVINVRGYIGNSTKNEIYYAKQQGKVVNYLENFLSLSEIQEGQG